MQTINATDLARRTRQILDTVLTSGETVVVQRNQVAIARIVPAENALSATQALNGFKVTLAPAQGRAWLGEGREAFGNEVSDPWA
jgi:antitoxin (DNA-binding transcriptional repressor) of toxin-antitoxin stability system